MRPPTPSARPLLSRCSAARRRPRHEPTRVHNRGPHCEQPARLRPPRSLVDSDSPERRHGDSPLPELLGAFRWGAAGMTAEPYTQEGLDALKQQGQPWLVLNRRLPDDDAARQNEEL